MNQFNTFTDNLKEDKTVACEVCRWLVWKVWKSPCRWHWKQTKFHGWQPVKHEVPQWWLREDNMIVGCINNRTHALCGFFGYCSTKSSVGVHDLSWKSCWQTEKGSEKSSRTVWCLENLPHRIKWSSSMTFSFEVTMFNFEEWLCLKE